MNNNPKEICRQMENNEIRGKKIHKVIVLELVEFFTIAPLNITEFKPKDIDFYRRTVKINGKGIAVDVFDVCDKETVLDVIKGPKGFRFFSCRWKNNKKIAY